MDADKGLFVRGAHILFVTVCHQPDPAQCLALPFQHARLTIHIHALQAVSTQANNAFSLQPCAQRKQAQVEKDGRPEDLGNIVAVIEAVRRLKRAEAFGYRRGPVLSLNTLARPVTHFLES